MEQSLKLRRGGREIGLEWRLPRGAGPFAVVVQATAGARRSQTVDPLAEGGLRPVLSIAAALLRLNIASLWVRGSAPCELDAALECEALAEGLRHPELSRHRRGLLLHGAAAASYDAFCDHEAFAGLQALYLIAPTGLCQKPRPAATAISALPETNAAWREGARDQSLSEMGPDGAFLRESVRAEGALHPGLIDRIATHFGAFLVPSWVSPPKL